MILYCMFDPTLIIFLIYVCKSVCVCVSVSAHVIWPTSRTSWLIVSLSGRPVMRVTQ